MRSAVLRRFLPLRVVVSLGISFAVIGVIVAAGAVFRDRHHTTHRPPATAPRSLPSGSPLPGLGRTP
jgi:hypothetical protein